VVCPITYGDDKKSNFEGENGQAQDMPSTRCIQSDSTGGNIGTVWMPIGVVLDGVHNGATWRVLLNCFCVAVMQPYVKLLLFYCQKEILVTE